MKPVKELMIRDRETLIQFVEKGKKFRYLYFWGHRRKAGEVTASCLSQWYGCSFESHGNRFATAEHFMMYQKAKLFDDNEVAKQILAAGSPGAAKALGRRVREFDEKIWSEKRFEIVVEANRLKFVQNEDLKWFLIGTKDRVLVEASPVDKIWGVGMAADNQEIGNPRLWQGLNLLGFALMQVRSELN